MSAEEGLIPENAAAPSTVKLLVVDDNEAICRHLAGSLTNAGFNVVTAHDASDAIAQASLAPPDVAIVDLGMPEVGGCDVVRHLKELRGASVHVIVLTGKDDEQSRADAFDAGTDDYVLKPIAVAEIRRRVSAAVRTQRALAQVQLEKEAAERRLVYGQEASALLAHDLNNSLSVSLGNLEYLVDTFAGDDDAKQALAATLQSVRRMSSLVANFVDIVRFEDAEVKPMIAQTRVHAMLQSVIEVHSSSVTRGASLEIDCPPELEARFDSGLVERVLHNLFGNATRYVNANGRITLAARRWLDDDDGSIEISVTNTGPQVPDGIRSNLFGKYVRSRCGKRGMGLYFCRLVAEAHGGRIEYEARSDGPCFVMRLPGNV